MVTSTSKSSRASHLLGSEEKSNSDSLSFCFWLTLKMKNC